MAGQRKKRPGKPGSELIQSEVWIPSSVFYVRSGPAFVHGKVQGHDSVHHGHMIVKCDGDPRRFFFPVESVREWALPPPSDAELELGGGGGDDAWDRGSNPPPCSLRGSEYVAHGTPVPGERTPGDGSSLAASAAHGSEDGDGEGGEGELAGVTGSSAMAVDDEPSGFGGGGAAAADGAQSFDELPAAARAPGTGRRKRATGGAEEAEGSGGAAAMPPAPKRRKRTGGGPAHARSAKTSRGQVKDLVGKTVDIPSSVFNVDVPDMFYTGRVLGPDSSHANSVIVKLRGDPAKYYFPAPEVRRWLQATQERVGQRVQGQHATTGHQSDVFAAEVLTEMLTDREGSGIGGRRPGGQQQQQQQLQQHGGAGDGSSISSSLRHSSVEAAAAALLAAARRGGAGLGGRLEREKEREEEVEEEAEGEGEMEALHMMAEVAAAASAAGGLELSGAQEEDGVEQRMGIAAEMAGAGAAEVAGVGTIESEPAYAGQWEGAAPPSRSRSPSPPPPPPLAREPSFAFGAPAAAASAPPPPPPAFAGLCVPGLPSLPSYPVLLVPESAAPCLLPGLPHLGGGGGSGVAWQLLPYPAPQQPYAYVPGVPLPDLGPSSFPPPGAHAASLPPLARQTSASSAGILQAGGMEGAGPGPSSAFAGSRRVSSEAALPTWHHHAASAGPSAADRRVCSHGAPAAAWHAFQAGADAGPGPVAGLPVKLEAEAAPLAAVGPSDPGMGAGVHGGLSSTPAAAAAAPGHVPDSYAWRLLLLQVQEQHQQQWSEQQAKLQEMQQALARLQEELKGRGGAAGGAATTATEAAAAGTDEGARGRGLEQAPACSAGARPTHGGAAAHEEGVEQDGVAILAQQPPVAAQGRLVCSASPRPPPTAGAAAAAGSAPITTGVGPDHRRMTAAKRGGGGGAVAGAARRGAPLAPPCPPRPSWGETPITTHVVLPSVVSGLALARPTWPVAGPAAGLSGAGPLSGPAAAAAAAPRPAGGPPAGPGTPEVPAPPEPLVSSRPVLAEPAAAPVPAVSRRASPGPGSEPSSQARVTRGAAAGRARGGVGAGGGGAGPSASRGVSPGVVSGAVEAPEARPTVTTSVSVPRAGAPQAQ